MNYKEFGSDLPRHRIVFTSAEENEETMKLFGVDQMVRQLGNGKFRSDLSEHIFTHSPPQDAEHLDFLADMPGMESE
jgi:hypothetical protein